MTGTRELSLLQTVQNGSGSSPLFEMYRCSFPGVKRPGRKVYCLIPSSAEVKNEWNYTSTFTTRLPCFDKDNFSFVFYLIALKVSVNLKVLPSGTLFARS